MKIEQISTVFFSPAGSTKKIATSLSGYLSELLGIPSTTIDLTSPASRQKAYDFDPDTLLVLALPVYAGRVPNKLLPDLKRCLNGSGSTAIVPVCVYGNRNKDEALREMLLLSESQGFVPIGAAAMVSRHAFSHELAKGRPDEEDLCALKDFSQLISEKIKAGADQAPSAIEYDRDTPVGPYYTPLRADLTPAKFLKAKPVNDTEKCTGCGTCARKCPVGSITMDGVAEVTGICIKCQACIRICPTQALSFEDEDFLSHVEMLEKTYTQRKEPMFLY